MDFTGERFIPTEKGEIRYEHMHRYGWVQSLCKGLRVLDIACGEGYGSALLADTAGSVTGVDISDEAVSHAKQRYASRANLQFLQGSATSVPLESGSVDVVVSFETIEHLAEQEEMMRELRRVLTPSGILVISSPNKKVYSDDRNYVNEFHVKELYFDEFDELLGRYFPARRHFAQRFITASALLPLGQTATVYEALLLTGNELKARTKAMDREMYFVAVCAANEELLPALAPNLFLDAESDLYSEQHDVRQWASGLHQEHSELQARHLTLNKEFEERTAWAESLLAENTVERNARLRLEAKTAELAELAAQTQRVVDQIMNSRSWRLMAPLRWLSRRRKGG